MIDSDAGVLMIMFLPDAFAPPPSSCLAFSPVNIILVVVTNVIMVFNQHHLHHKVRFAWYPSYCIVIISAIIIEMISVIFSVIISVIIIGMISVIISVIISVVISVVISVIIIDMIMVPSDVSLLPRLRQVFCATMTAMEGSTDSAQPGSVRF